MVNYKLYEGTGALATVATKSKCRWRKRVGVEPTFEAREGLERQL